MTGGKSDWSAPAVGSIGGHETTFSTNSNGESRLGDGDRTGNQGFEQSGNHDHYGSGNGPNNNGTDRGAYTGSGSSNDDD